MDATTGQPIVDVYSDSYTSDCTKTSTSVPASCDDSDTDPTRFNASSIYYMAYGAHEHAGEGHDDDEYLDYFRLGILDFCDYYSNK